MSTLNGILGIATSALQTAQTGLSVVSDNISNVNTAGYIRKTTSQTSLTAAGAGQGVSIAKVNLAANAYLQEVALRAASDSSRAGAVYNNLNLVVRKSRLRIFEFRNAGLIQYVVKPKPKPQPAQVLPEQRLIDQEQSGCSEDHDDKPGRHRRRPGQ